MAGLTNPDTTLTITFQVHFEFFARKAGSHWIFEPQLFHNIEYPGETPENRTTALLNMSRYVAEDSIAREVECASYPEYYDFMTTSTTLAGKKLVLQSR